MAASELMNRRHFLRNGLWIATAPALLIPRRSKAQVYLTGRGYVTGLGSAGTMTPSAGGGGGAYVAPDILGWKCNEGSGTNLADSSTNGTTDAGTLSASTFWATGFPNGNTNYLNLNGTSQNGNSSAAVTMPATSLITVEFRINQSSYSTTTAQVYVDYLGGNANTFQIFNDTNGNSGTVIIKIFDNGGNQSSFSIARPTASAWHHIAYAIDNSAANKPTAYVDGSSVTVTQNNDTRVSFANFGNRVLTIGSQNGGSLWAPASMKDFRIWNGLRSAGNIASDATNYP